MNESQDPSEQQSIIEKKITSKKFRSQTVGFVVKVRLIFCFRGFLAGMLACLAACCVLFVCCLLLACRFVYLSDKSDENAGAAPSKQIGMIDKNEFVCEEDMRSNNQFKKYSLVCESKEGVVRQFTKAAFQYFVQSREETREAIAKRLKSKQEEIFDKLDEYYRSYEENKLKLPKIKAKNPNLSVSQSQKQFISNRLWGIPTKNLSS